MDEPDAQIGADDLEMTIDERAPVVAVQFSGQPAAAQGFLEAIEQRLGVGGQPVVSEGNEPGVIIDDHAQMRRHRLGVRQPIRRHLQNNLGGGCIPKILYSILCLC